MNSRNEITSAALEESEVEAYAARRGMAMRALLRWSLVFTATTALLLLVVYVGDLRTVDLVFVPTTILVIVASLTLGHTIGTLLTLRQVRPLVSPRASRSGL